MVVAFERGIRILALILFLAALCTTQAASASSRPPLFIVPRLDGGVSAFNALTGKLLWNFSTGGPLLQSSEASVSSTEVAIFNSIQREGAQDLFESPGMNFLGATPFMSSDGTIFLSHKVSTLFVVDPLTGEIVSSSNKLHAPEGIFTGEQALCKSVLQIVRTEHTLETHNGSSTHFLTMSNIRAFLRDCHGDEVSGGRVDTATLPTLTATPLGDLQAYDSNGNAIWFSNLPASPANIVYGLASSTLYHIRPNLPPKLPSKYVPLSLSNYKGTPYEFPFGVPELTKTLALPAPVDSHDLARKSIWYWIATIFVCTTAAIWGLVILKYQRFHLAPPTPAPAPPPPPPLPPVAPSIPRSDSSLRLRADNEQLQKQLNELLQLHRSQSPQSGSVVHSRQPSLDSSGAALSRYRTDFEEKERIGEGGFGTVFRAINNLDGVEYAVKKVCLSAGSKENERVLREVRHLAVLDHPNIIRYYQSWVEEDEWNGSRSEGEYEESDEGDVTEESEGDDDSEIDESEDKGSESDDGKSEDAKSDLSCNLSSLDGSKDSLFGETSSFRVLPIDLADEANRRQKKGGKPSKIDKKKKLVKKRYDLDITFERTYGSTSDSYSGVKEKRSESPATHRRTILYIQMQYCHQGSLHHWLSRPDRVVCAREAIAIFQQLVRGVAHVHANFFIHRDLKPPNILISADGSVKIGDFGLSTGAINDGPVSPVRVLTRSHTTGVGSPFYCSPEQLTGDRYDAKVDIFSLGIILYEMFHIFSTQMERASHITQLRSGIINEQTQDLYPNLAELVLHLVQANPTHRPIATEILTHPFLNQ